MKIMVNARIGWVLFVFVSYLSFAGTDEPILVADFERIDQLLFASDGLTSEQFGRAVGIDKSVIAIGARRDSELSVNSGAVYVFERDGGLSWHEIQKVFPSDHAPGKQFGRSVAVNQDRIAIGAADLLRPGNLGTAYIFEKSDNGSWEEVALLSAAETESDGSFGVSVAMSDKYLAVGDSAVDGFTGSVTIFERNQLGKWLRSDTLLASNGKVNDGFGFSISMDGDRLAVGGASFSRAAGNAYVFERQTNGTWEEVASFAPHGPNAEFGIDVGIQGDTAVVGANGEESGVPGAGATYVYWRSTTGEWAFETKLTPSDSRKLSQFGSTVEIGVGRILIAAEQDTFVNNFAGAVYIFDRQINEEWVEVGKLGPIDPDTGDAFGFSLAIDQGQALIGAFADEAQGRPKDSGTALFFN